MCDKWHVGRKESQMLCFHRRSNLAQQRRGWRGDLASGLSGFLFAISTVPNLQRAPLFCKKGIRCNLQRAWGHQRMSILMVSNGDVLGERDGHRLWEILGFTATSKKLNFLFCLLGGIECIDTHTITQDLSSRNKKIQWEGQQAKMASGWTKVEAILSSTTWWRTQQHST